MNKHFVVALIAFVTGEGVQALRYDNSTTLTGWGDQLKERGEGGTLPASTCQRNVVAAAARAVAKGLPERETAAWVVMEWARGYLPEGAELTAANLKTHMPEGNFRDVTEHLWVLA